MKMVVFGSLNIDKTYSLEDFVRPGQTISASKMEQFCGGKGFNQASLCAARAMKCTSPAQWARTAACCWRTSTATASTATTSR